MRLSRLLFLRFVLALSLGLTACSLRAQNDAASRREAIEEIYPVMIAALQAKNYGRARNICDQVILWEPQNPNHHYNLACIEAQAGGARLPYAWGALELAVALGFNDAAHFQADPDLIPLRRDARFAGLLRKVMLNASADDAIAGLAVPAAPKLSVPAPAPASEEPGETPPPATFADGLPVGLYYMTRYHSLTRVLEQSVWYFSADGTAYQNLKYGFSAADLARHTGPKGTARLQGATLEIAWSDGTTLASELEKEGLEFTWSRGIFSPITAFETAAEVAGIYQGGETIVAGKLELRPDGTFTWEDGARSSNDPDSSWPANGRWELQGLSLVFTPETGAPLRRIAFPRDDEKTVVKPDRMFLGGIMFRRLP